MRTSCNKRKTEEGPTKKVKPTPTPRRVTVTTTAFTDDLCFYITGGDPAALQQKAQSVMDKAAAWSVTKGMRFSSSKTEAIIFSRKKYTKPRPITLNGTPLTYSPLVKYLGVYIDSKLLWKDHVDIKLKKAKKALMAVVRLTTLPGEFHHNALHTTGSAAFYQCSLMEHWCGTACAATKQSRTN